MVNFVQRRILGRWREGFSLDFHTLGSIFIGYDEYGHPRFDTTRSEVGELLYRLKNRGDESAIPEIVLAIETLMNTWKPPVEALVPVPPSTHRRIQPVLSLSRIISERLEIPLVDCVKRTRNAPQLKNIYDLDERIKLLHGLHSVDRKSIKGRTVLLFDDLFRSGATMNSITTELYEAGEANDVYALTVTQTRRYR